MKNIVVSNCMKYFRLLICFVALSNVGICLAQSEYVPTEEEKQDTIYVRRSDTGKIDTICAADLKKALYDASEDYEPDYTNDTIATKALKYKLYKFSKAERDSIWKRAEQQELKWKIRDTDSLRISLEAAVKAKDPSYTHTIIPYIFIRDMHAKDLPLKEQRRRAYEHAERSYQYSTECDTLAAFVLRNKCFRFTRQEKQDILQERMRLTLRWRIDADSVLRKELEQKIEIVEKTKQ